MDRKDTALFVYGTLRSGLKHEAYDYISEYFEWKGEAKVSGVLYDLGSYPGAVPAAEEAFVSGELYELKKGADFEWVIAQLDDYEGSQPADGEAELYRREVTEVWCNNEKSLAWIYWFAGDVAGRKRITSGDIMEYIETNKCKDGSSRG